VYTIGYARILHSAETRLSNLARMILDTFESLPERPTAMAEQLQRFAQLQLEAGDKVEVFETVITPEIDARIRRMRKCEEEGDLCWFNYNSWNSLPVAMRESITGVLDPLFWTGVFFSKRAFEKSQAEFFRYFNDLLSIYVVTSKRYSQFIAHSDITPPVKWDGRQSVDLVNRLQASSVIRSFCLRGGVVVAVEH